MGMSLARLEPGSWAWVKRIEMDSGVEERLRDFGMVPGTRVGCRYRSPGDHMTALEFRGTVVALRTRDLERIGVSLG